MTAETPTNGGDEMTPTLKEQQWYKTEQDHRVLYLTGGHGPWMYCGCEFARWMRENIP